MIGQWCKYYQVVCYPLHYDLMSRFSANDQIKTLEAGILVQFFLSISNEEFRQVIV